MKFKTLVVLLFVLTGLLALAFVKKAMEKKQLGRPAPAIETFDLTKGLTEGFVSKVVVYKGQEGAQKVVLSKDPSGVWTLESRFGIRARQDGVSGLLSDLASLRGEVRADSKSVLEDFGVTDAQGLHLILSAGQDQVLKHLIFSLNRPSWGLNFVRLDGSDKIVEVSKDILSRFALYSKEAELDKNLFADLKVFSFDPASVIRVELASSAKGGSFSLIRGEDKDGAGEFIWKCEPPVSAQDVDPARVREYLQNVAGLYAQDIFDPAQETYGLKDPQLVVKMRLSSAGDETQLVVGGSVPDKASHYAQASSQQPVFLISDASFKNLKKEKTFFFKPKAPKK